MAPGGTPSQLTSCQNRLHLKLRSRQEKVHAHSFVLRPELGIQYTYVKILSTTNLNWIHISRPFLRNFCYKKIAYTYLIMSWLTNFNLIQIHVRQKSLEIQNVSIPVWMALIRTPVNRTGPVLNLFRKDTIAYGHLCTP